MDSIQQLEFISIVLILGLAAVLTVCETRWPAHDFPETRNWWPRVATLQALVMFIVTVGVSTWQETLIQWRLWDGTKYLSGFGGGVVTYIIGSFVFYWWHRLRHENQLCWRTFHQMHHSPSRIQAVTAFYVHPLEAVASSLLNAVLVFVVFGLTKEALVWNALFMALAGVFYHCNLSTPRWVGLFVQRPEMHRYHHEIDVHGRNYSDLPMWDMIFGTYHNPQKFVGECGFHGGRELEFFNILLGKDVNPKILNNSKLSSHKESKEGNPNGTEQHGCEFKSGSTEVRPKRIAAANDKDQVGLSLS